MKILKMSSRTFEPLTSRKTMLQIMPKTAKMATLAAVLLFGADYGCRRYQEEPVDKYISAKAANGEKFSSKNSNMDEFVKSLHANSSKLIKALGINQEQYENYRRLAIGIAKEETNFGLDYSATMKKHFTTPARIIKGLTGIITGNSCLSEGLTNYKITQNQKTNEMDLRDEFGIDDVTKPAQSAVATIIHLHCLSKDFPKYKQNFPDKEVTLNEYLLTRWNGKLLSKGDERAKILADRTSDEPTSYAGKILHSINSK